MVLDLQELEKEATPLPQEYIPPEHPFQNMNRFMFTDYAEKIVQSDFPDDVKRHLLEIITTKDVPLANLPKQWAEIILAGFDVNFLEIIVSGPPQESIFSHSPDGSPKMNMNQAKMLTASSTVLVARVTRGIDGFERRMLTQSTNVQIQEAEKTKPSLFERFFGGR